MERSDRLSLIANTEPVSNITFVLESTDKGFYPGRVVEIWREGFTLDPFEVRTVEKRVIADRDGENVTFNAPLTEAIAENVTTLRAV